MIFPSTTPRAYAPTGQGDFWPPADLRGVFDLEKL